MNKAFYVLLLPVMLGGCIVGERTPADVVATSQSRSLKEEKALQSTIRFDIGSLEITKDQSPGLLYSYVMEYDRSSFAPNVHYEIAPDNAEGLLSLSLEGKRKTKVHPQRSNNRLYLSFGDSVPLKLQIGAGVGDARLLLSGLKISSMDFESGVGEAKLSAYEPNPISCEHLKLKNGVGRLEGTGLGNLNFRRLEFEGGVGSASLDLSGDWRQDAEVRIRVGVGGIDLRIPREIGVKVESTENFLSGLHLEGFNKKDSYHYSDNYEKADIKLFIHITSGVGGLRISWI